jgi:hypothetical protein
VAAASAASSGSSGACPGAVGSTWPSSATPPPKLPLPNLPLPNLRRLVRVLRSARLSALLAPALKLYAACCWRAASPPGPRCAVALANAALAAAVAAVKSKS